MRRGALLALACVVACSPTGEPASDAVEVRVEARAVAAPLSADGYSSIRIGMTPEEAFAAFGQTLTAFRASTITDPRRS